MHGESYLGSFERHCEEPTNGSFQGPGKTQDDEGQVGIGRSKEEGVGG
jgi:hypothetical protein